MGLAKYVVKKTNKDRFFGFSGIIFILLSAVFIGKDIYQLARFDRVESTLKVTNKHNGSGYKAHATYEYQGKRYEDKVLSYYNGVTMKDDEKFNVLIDPAKPDQPHTTTFFLDACFLIVGIPCLSGGLKKDRS